MTCQHRSYRCFLVRSTAIVESGQLEYVQLRAQTAYEAARLALAVTGALAVAEVQRIEP